MEFFADLMHSLGEILDTELIPDLNQTVSLMVNENFVVNMELSRSGEKLILASFIVELPPGKFREETLKYALKANYASDVNAGTLAYVSNHNTLVLLQEIEIHGLKAEKLYEDLLLFVDRATAWKSAIDSGRLYPEEREEIPKIENAKGQKIFGF